MTLAFCNKNQVFKFYCTPHNDTIYVHLLNRCNTFQIGQENHFFFSSLLPNVSEYDQEIAQSHTWHREEEPQNINSNETSNMVKHYHKHHILSPPCNTIPQFERISCFHDGYTLYWVHRHHLIGVFDLINFRGLKWLWAELVMGGNGYLPE